MNVRNCSWVTASQETPDICPVFRRVFNAEKPVLEAELSVTVLGVYYAVLNGKPAGDFVLAPGWTSYTAAACRFRHMT